MEIKVLPYHIDQYPIHSFFIEGNKLAYWIKQIGDMEISLENCEVYPIPGIEPNSVYGCLVNTKNVVKGADVGKHIRYQLVEGLLFIPERSRVLPSMLPGELKKVLNERKHFFHPHIGFCELTEPIRWMEHIDVPTIQPVDIYIPESPVYVPSVIRTCQVVPTSTEETIMKMEEQNFPKPEKLKDKPLNIFEKIKLSFYKGILKSDPNGKPVATGPGGKAVVGIFDKISNLFSKNKTVQSIAEKWGNDMADLEDRNQKELDKLLDIFKKDPKEALKYAIPIDPNGTNRGPSNGGFTLEKRWFNFSIFDNDRNRSGGGSVNFGDQGLIKLQNQYRKTAEELIKQGDYMNAAFIYLKLLNAPYAAGNALMQGKYYQEAASIFLKNNHKALAAECYEKGNMKKEAIELYKQLYNHEKVGDLYMDLGKKDEAREYYELVIKDYKSRRQYLKAADMYRNKVEDREAGQATLLEGWRERADGVQCLNSYFSHIEDEKKLSHEIERMYTNEVNVHNEELFVHVLHNEYKKKNKLAPRIKDMAYEIIVRKSASKPDIISELKFFNPNDKELVKDTMRFKSNRRRLG